MDPREGLEPGDEGEEHLEGGTDGAQARDLGLDHSLQPQHTVGSEGFKKTLLRSPLGWHPSIGSHHRRSPRPAGSVPWRRPELLAQARCDRGEEDVPERDLEEAHDSVHQALVADSVHGGERREQDRQQLLAVSQVRLTLQGGLMGLPVVVVDTSRGVGGWLLLAIADFGGMASEDRFGSATYNKQRLVYFRGWLVNLLEIICRVIEMFIEMKLLLKLNSEINMAVTIDQWMRALRMHEKSLITGSLTVAGRTVELPLLFY